MTNDDANMLLNKGRSRIDSALREATPPRKDLLQRVASVNAISHTTVICVVAYFQAAGWIVRLGS